MVKSVDDDLIGGAAGVPRRVGDTATVKGPVGAPDTRYAAVQQYSLARILGVWAAAAVPMALLAWVVAPWLSDQLSGDESLARALLVCLTLGLIWQFVLVLILMRHELGTLRRAPLREALWLRPPRGPVGGKTWWWAALFVFLAAVLQLVPSIPGPSSRDFADFLTSDRGEAFFQGAWGWFVVIVVFVVFNTIIGEELLFRGVLLPRMKNAFGRADWVANGVLLAIYHLHQPWSMPSSLVEGVFLEAYPSRRFQSAWMGIIVHSLQSVFVLTIVFALVVG